MGVGGGGMHLLISSGFILEMKHGSTVVSAFRFEFFLPSALIFFFCILNFHGRPPPSEIFGMVPIYISEFSGMVPTVLMIPEKNASLIQMYRRERAEV